LRPADGPPPRTRRRARPLLPGPLSVAIAYLLARLWQVLLLGAPIVGPDSPMYRAPGQHWLEFAPAVSYDGAALRPWPVTLLYALGASDEWRMLLQFGIATACWTYCIYQVGAVARRRTWALAGGVISAALALTAGVSSWDALILSESLSLSMVALYFGGILSLSRGGRFGAPRAWLAASVAALCLALIRPVLVLLIAVPALVPCWAWLRSRRRPRSPRRQAVSTWVAVAALLVAAAGATYTWAYNVRSDKQWGDWMSVPGQNGRTIQQYYVTTHNTRFGPNVVTALNGHGAPPCLAESYHPNDTIQTFLGQALDHCREGLKWVSNNYVVDLTGVLVSHPVLAEQYFSSALQEQAQQRPDGIPSLPTPVPGFVANLFFTDGPSFPNPLIAWSVVAVGLLLLWLWRRPRSRPPVNATVTERRTTGTAVRGPAVGQADPAYLRLVVGATVAAGYAGLVGTALLSPVDIDRVGLPATTLLRLGLLVAIVRCLETIDIARARNGRRTWLPASSARVSAVRPRP